VGVFLFSNVTEVEFSQGSGNRGANLILFKKIWIVENLWELRFTTCAQSELRGQTYDTTIICMTFAPLKVLPGEVRGVQNSLTKNYQNKFGIIK
jgi:hypothetical protein